MKYFRYARLRVCRVVNYISSPPLRDRIMHALAFLLTVFLLTAASAASLAAQASTGSLLGTVKDTDGAVLPGVTVVAINAGTNARSETATDGSGAYIISNLPPGRYRLEASLQGFKQFVQDGIVLQVQQQALVDVALQVGVLNETVSVVANASVLDATTSAVGKVVDNARIQSLPLNTRNIYSLIYLTPGVQGSIGNSHNQVGYSINGVRGGLMETLVDGISAAFPTVNGFHGVSVFPSVDAVQEFKVQAGSYSAEYGRSLAGVLNLVYKSGTNQVHGSAFEFYRNSAFDANTYFGKQRNVPLADFDRSQFGGMTGGPIQTDRTFFMVSYEGLRQNSFREVTTTVPTAAQRAGDFSATRGANGQQIVIYDPLTTRANANGTGNVRDPFQGNRIPRERMDPVALNVLKYWPEPNQPGDPVTGANNFYASGSAQVQTDNFDVRIDRNLGGSRRLFGRYSYRRSYDAPPQLFPGDTGVAEGRINLNDRGTNIVLDYSDQVRGQNLINVRLGYARNAFLYDNQALGFSPTSLGLPADIEANVDRPMFPAFGMTDVASLGGGDHRSSGFNNYILAGNLSRAAGRHFLKAGYEGRMYRINVWEARAAGQFSFTRQFTQGPNPLAATALGGHGFASFLLGAGNSGLLYQNWKNVAAQSFYHAVYLQDDWRIGEKLTINAGIRYDFDMPRTERYDRMSWFDPEVASPLASTVPGMSNLRGGLEFVGAAGNPRSQFDGDWDNVAPRLGAAYQLNSKTVIRGAFGRFYGPSTLAAQGTVGPYGFRVETPWVASIDNLTPLNYLRNPFPQGFRPVPGASDGLLTALGSRVEAPLRDTTVPNIWQFNVTVQRELPANILVEAAYVGNRGRELSLGGEGGYTLNQLDPQYMSLGAALNQPVPNPFYGSVATGPLSLPTVARGQLLRPYPQFGDIIPLFYPGAESSYDAFQLTVKRNFAGGLGFEGNYVASKSMDWGQSYQNSYDTASANALSGVHIPYRLVLSTIYQLPIGRDRAIGRNMSPALDAIIGGWQVNGIWTLQAGPLLTLGVTNSSGVFGQATRANWTGADPTIDGAAEDKLARWFDTSVFSQPAPFTFGNALERIPGLTAHRLNSVDFSVFKEVRPTAALRLELRIEAFNLLNYTQFGNPNTTLNSASFGQVTTQANAPRQMQFGVKMIW
jgi:hypothetical protein